MLYKKIFLSCPALIIFMIIFCSPVPAFAQAEETGTAEKKEETESLPDFIKESIDEISFYSLEELLNSSISSVSKKREQFMDTASSVYVVTDEDIRRSASTRLIEVLGMVPGFSYQELTYTTPMYGIRKYYDLFPQTILMLVDGVPVISAITGGVLFQYFQMPLQQIDRIEVIKGPGGTMYGANANTGIISIYTKNGKNSEGLFVDLNAATFVEPLSRYYVSPYFRFGHRVSDSLSYMAYGNFIDTTGYPKTRMFDGDSVTDPKTGTTSQNKYTNDNTDGLRAYTAGASLQWDITKSIESSTSVSYSNTSSNVYTRCLALPEPFIKEEKNEETIVSEKVDFHFNKGHEMFMFMYFRNEDILSANGGGIKGAVRTYNLEIQDNITLFGFNDLSFGGNGRIVQYDIEKNPVEYDTNFTKLEAVEDLEAGFIQDTVRIGKHVDYTLGCKAERWSLISDKFELSPSTRLAVRPNDDITIWTAASKSITIPGYIQARVERRVAPWPLLQNSYVVAQTGDDIEPTSVWTYEAGARTSIIPKMFLDISAFYTMIRDSIDLDTSNIERADAHTEQSRVHPDETNVPVYYTNLLNANEYGGEAVLKTFPVKNIRIELTYSYFRYRIEDSQQKIPLTPRHTIGFRPYVDIPAYDLFLSLNMIWKSKSRIYGYNYQTQGGDITNYDNNLYIVDPPQSRFILNAQIEKRFYGGALTARIWGRNLLYKSYNEGYNPFIDNGYPHTIGRYIGAGVSYQM